MSARKLKVVVTQNAAGDLRETLSYSTGEWGVTRARQYQRHIFRRFEQIASHPAVGQLREDLGSDIRMAVVERHLAFYRVHDGVVEVLRVIHQSRDISPRDIVSND